MDFTCLSISHQTTTLDIREKLSCAQPDLKAALAQTAAHSEQFFGPDAEIAILATCNRFELYLARQSGDPSFPDQADEPRRALLNYLTLVTGCPGIDLAAYSVVYQGMEAVGHLFRVACGLESQVVGEAQILGQVAESLAVALEAGSARHTLASLFRAALHAAKRAHTETAIGRKPASLSSVAAGLAEQALGKVDGRPVVVIGAGEMGALALRALHARGAQQLTVINRTYASAARLARRYACQARPWEELGQALQAADVVVSATAAQHPILTLELLRGVMSQRRSRPLLLLDIAVPRDVDPQAADLPGVTLVDLDEMKLRLDQSLEHRLREAGQVDAILREELLAFSHWMEVIPTVGKLHRKAEMIRRQEVERALQNLPDLDPQVRAQIEVLTRSLVKKLFHEPSSRMRNGVNNEELRVYTTILHTLFGLDEDDPRPVQRREAKPPREWKP